MIEEKGPWAAAYTNDKAFIESDDFTHDVRLYVSGDFESIEQRVEYAEEIAKRLNAFASRDAEIVTLKGMVNEIQAARHVQREHNALLVKNHKLREQVELYEQALAASWPDGAMGDAFDFWNAARKLAAAKRLGVE